MKKLQNNFTTPEQSKRLLELGVPADSADCYYDKYRILPLLLFNGDTMQDLLDANEPEDPDEYLPCWSVGRLIEIYEICSGEKFERADDGLDIMQDAFETILYLRNTLDFSKLEE